MRTSHKRGTRTRDALATWDNEGGALAAPGPGAAFAQLRRGIFIPESLAAALVTDGLPPHPDRAPAGPKSCEANQP